MVPAIAFREPRTRSCAAPLSVSRIDQCHQHRAQGGIGPPLLCGSIRANNRRCSLSRTRIAKWQRGRPRLEFRPTAMVCKRARSSGSPDFRTPGHSTSTQTARRAPIFGRCLGPGKARRAAHREPRGHDDGLRVGRRRLTTNGGSGDREQTHARPMDGRPHRRRPPHLHGRFC
jgi:hypothetical protein